MSNLYLRVKVHFSCRHISVLAVEDSNRSEFNTRTKPTIHSPWAKAEGYNIKKEVTLIVTNVTLRVKRQTTAYSILGEGFVKF
jgi:hypothetical protein